MSFVIIKSHSFIKFVNILQNIVKLYSENADSTEEYMLIGCSCFYAFVCRTRRKSHKSNFYQTLFSAFKTYQSPFDGRQLPIVWRKVWYRRHDTFSSTVQFSLDLNHLGFNFFGKPGELPGRNISASTGL